MPMQRSGILMVMLFASSLLAAAFSTAAPGDGAMDRLAAIYLNGEDISSREPHRDLREVSALAEAARTGREKALASRIRASILELLAQRAFEENDLVAADSLVVLSLEADPRAGAYLLQAHILARSGLLREALGAAVRAQLLSGTPSASALVVELSDRLTPSTDTRRSYLDALRNEYLLRDSRIAREAVSNRQLDLPGPAVIVYWDAWLDRADAAAMKQLEVMARSFSLDVVPVYVGIELQEMTEALDRFDLPWVPEDVLHRPGSWDHPGLKTTPTVLLLDDGSRVLARITGLGRAMPATVEYLIRTQP